MPRLGRTLPVQSTKTWTPLGITPPLFDALGGYYAPFNGGSSSTISISTTNTAGSYLIVDVACPQVLSQSATYNGIPMTMLASVALYSTNPSPQYGNYTRFGLPNISGGTKTVLITLSASTILMVAACVSYNGVASQSTSSRAAATNGLGVQSVSLKPNYFPCVVNGFGAAIGASPNYLLNNNGGNQRFNNGTGNVAYWFGMLNIADSVAPISNFTASINTYYGYGSSIAPISTVLYPNNVTVVPPFVEPSAETPAPSSIAMMTRSRLF